MILLSNIMVAINKWVIDAYKIYLKGGGLLKIIKNLFTDCTGPIDLAKGL